MKKFEDIKPDIGTCDLCEKGPKEVLYTCKDCLKNINQNSQ